MAAEEFRTNPGKWIVEGNIAGTELTDLTDFTNWTGHLSTISSDGTIEHQGKSFNVAKIVYQP
jgi:hypothetical protein